LKYVDEIREPVGARRYAKAIARITTRPGTIMEICGGQTHSIVRHGLTECCPRREPAAWTLTLRSQSQAARVVLCVSVQNANETID